MSIKFIDLFSGCGGLTEAFLNNKKFSPIKIIDNDNFWITSEAEFMGSPFLYKISL